MSNLRKLTASSYGWWWGAVVLVLGFGAFVQLHHIDTQRLVWDYDEAYLYRMGHELLTEQPITTPHLLGYPPGLFWVERVVYCTVVAPNCGDNALQTSAVLRYMTLLAGIANVFTALILALTVRAWVGGLPALAAALIWLCLLPVMDKTLLALTEAWQILGYSLAVYGAVLVLKTERPHYALLGTLGGLFAVIFKYSAFPALGPATAAVLWLWWQHAAQRRTWLLVLGVQAGLIVGCALGLLFGYGAWDFFRNPNEVATFLNPDGNPNVNLQSSETGIVALLNAQAYQIGVALPLILGGLSIGTLIYIGRRTTWERLSWLLIVGMVIAHTVVVLRFIFIWAGVLRYTTPITAVLVTVLVVAVVSMGQWLNQRRRGVGSALVGLLLALWLIPNMFSAWYAAAVERPKAFTQWAYVRWTETSLPTDAALQIYFQDWLFFTTDYGTYALPDRAWVQGTFTDQPLADWLERGILYATLLPNEEKTLQATAAGQAEFDQMLRLKRFPPPHSDPAQWRGETMSVYRLRQPQYATETVFGGQIRLLGYDLSATTLKGGETLQFAPFWQAQTTPSTDLTVYVHLVALDDRAVLAQADGTPALPTRPTSTWNDPAEVLLGSKFALTIPTDLPSGEYRLIIGLYDWRSGERWRTAENNDFVEIAVLTITAP
jgi:hypothetical protein